MFRHLRLLLFLAALAVGALATPAAHAAPTPVNSGQIDWGVKQSFRSYIVGPIAHGSITTSDGATQAASNGIFTFPLVTGTVDADADTADVCSRGAVHFYGHDGLLDFTLSDIRVQIGADGATLIADAVSKSLETGQPETYEDTPLADLDTTGITPTADGEDVTWTNVPAKLTEDGAPAFGGFYTAGTDLDPVTFTASPAGTGSECDPAPAPPPTPPADSAVTTPPPPPPPVTRPATVAAATVKLGTLSRSQRTQLARGRTVTTAVRVNRAGRVSLVVRGRLSGKTRILAHASKRATKAGLIKVRWRLSKAARAHLARRKALRIRVTATAPGVRKPSSYALTVKR